MATTLTKANAYIGKNLFGILSKVTAPDIEMETTEIKNAFGSYSLPIGVKSMKTSVTIQGFDKTVFNKISNPFGEINFTIYGEIDEYSNETLLKGEQAKLTIRGSSNKFSLLGELEQQKNIDYQIDFEVSAAKLEIGGKEQYNIDIPNAIWRAGGVDMLAHMRKSLALD